MAAIAAMTMLSTPIINMMSKPSLFALIQERMKSVMTTEFIKSTVTVKGNTQNSERDVISKVKSVLDGLSLEYSEAGSQQSKDFRNVGGIGLDIEVKKTDNTTIYFNDTCPSPDIYYIVIFTGKEYKCQIEKNIAPQVCYLNGADFLQDSPWINDYINELTVLKDKYARGENKKHLTGLMSVYPRPTFKADITAFLSKPVVVPSM